MCGIVALHSSGRPVSAAAISRAVAALHHRGPDGQGTWIAPDGRTGLGHARLSIIDLEGGVQPIANETSDVRIVVNGEFYGYEEIRQRLEAAGHRFRTRSDSEIALHLYEDHGVEAVRHLRGEFAFTIWDARKQTLYAFRDRYGIKPLFYSQHNGVLYIASEMKALFAAGVPARWDLESVYFGVGLRGARRTLFEGVFAVPPGCYLEAGPGGVRLQQYWDIDYPRAGERPPPGSEAELREEFRALLEESVRLRLRADVPVACYLSGGLDSCCILGLAARHSSGPLRAFTLRFEDADYDEGDVAAEMAAHAGAEHLSYTMREDDLADGFADAVFHAEGTCRNTHGIAKFLLSRRVREAGFKVVLTGEGADEVLAGYPHFRQDMLISGDAGGKRDQVLKQLEELHRANPVSRGRLLTTRADRSSALMEELLGYTPSWVMSRFGALKGRHLPLAYDRFSAFAGRDPGELLLSGLDPARRLAGRAAVHQALYLWAKSMLPNYILATLGDRMEMAHSVEGRLPFLDHKVGEFLQRVPLKMKIQGQVEKYLLREATRDVVTQTVYRRQKHPFLAPQMSFAPGSRFFELAQDTLRSTAVDAVPFFDAPRVREVADLLPKMDPERRQVAEPRLLFLMSVVFLHQRLGVQG
jgi:asparagine synthase (glutamine-hydrolysing)